MTEIMRYVHIHCYGPPLDERIDERFGALAERRAGGCCGSHDEVFRDEETGRELTIGCNYGH